MTTESEFGKILIVGFGPGSADHITARARAAIQESQAIIGYNTYVDLIRELLTGQEIVRTGMTEEISRAHKAVDFALAGKTVAVISSGDAGVYGMAGLVYEVLLERGWHEGDAPFVEVIPGISAIQSCAALLGAPVMHDACTISLSDHLTPWEVIEKRLEAAAAADFVVALYNPKSGRRTKQIVEAQRILLKYRDAKTPVGLVKSAYRQQQHIIRTTLADMLNHEIGMLTTVVIGNSSTFYHGSLMITPRGYQRKYTIQTETQRLRPGDRLKPENEPWSLNAKTLVEDAQSSLSQSMPLQQENRLPVDTESEAGWQVAMETSNSVQLHPAPSAKDWADAAWLAFRGERLSDVASVQSVPSAGAGAATTSAPKRILEIAVSPGVANKKFNAAQLTMLAQVIGEEGEMEYTTSHEMTVRTVTENPTQIVDMLRSHGLRVLPVGEVIKVKACDFCDGEKVDGIPFAEQIANRLAGLSVEKELRIGFNGCAMSCYGAVHEDIGLVFRKGKFDLFLGGKTTGRNAMPAARVAEGIPAAEMPDLLEKIVQTYRDQAYPGERFYKFFQRVGEVAGFVYQEQKSDIVADTVCGS